MGFVQLAKIEKLSVDEIKNSIDDEPNNNIVEITGVNPDDSTIKVESPKGTARKRNPILTPYKKMLGQYTDDGIKMMNSVHDYIMNKNPEKDFDDAMWIHN